MAKGSELFGQLQLPVASIVTGMVTKTVLKGVVAKQEVEVTMYRVDDRTPCRIDIRPIPKGGTARGQENPQT